MISIILGLLAVLMVGLSIFTPKKGVVVVIFSALVITGMTSYFAPNWGQIAWVITIASFALLFPSMMSIGKFKNQKGNLLSLIMMAFCIFSILSLVINFNYIGESFASAKNIFQFWTIPLLAYVTIINTKVKNTISRLVLLIAFIQIPISVYQYFFVVDWVTRIAGGDSIVGTFGGSVDGGGNSGAQTTFLVIIWTFMVAYYIQQKKVRTIWLMISFLLLIPILLNETKIFLAYLPIVMIQLFFSFWKSHTIRTVFVTSLMGGAGFGVLIFYFLFLQHSGYGMSDSKDLESYIDQRISSSSGLSLKANEEVGLTRLGSIIYWWDEHSLSQNPIKMFLGHGLGASKGSGLFRGHLYNEYKYMKLRLDRTGLSKFLWDVGIIGTFLFIMIFVTAYLMLQKILRRQDKSSIEIANIVATKIGLTVLLVGNIYDTYLIRNQGLNILFACFLAYTFYIYRESAPKTNKMKT